MDTMGITYPLKTKKRPGRPPKQGQAMKQVGILMPPEMIAALKQLPGEMSENIREMIRAALEAAK